MQVGPPGVSGDVALETAEEEREIGSGYARLPLRMVRIGSPAHYVMVMDQK